MFAVFLLDEWLKQSIHLLLIGCLFSLKLSCNQLIDKMFQQVVIVLM